MNSMKRSSQPVLSGKFIKRNNLVFGDSPNRDRVEPNLFRADSLSSEDPFEHAVEPLASRDAFERRLAEPVEADV